MPFERIQQIGFNGLGGYYTVSGEVYASIPVLISIDLCDSGVIDIAVTTSPKKFVMKANVTSHYTSSGYNGFFDIVCHNTDTKTIYFKNFKIEYGNVDDPEWTPCPFDINISQSTNTSLSGLLKGNGSTVSAAVAGTDYLTPSSGKASSASSADKVNHSLTLKRNTPGGISIEDIVYNGSNDTSVTLESYDGDGVTIINTANVFSLAPSGVSAAVYGSERYIPKITIDKYGRISKAEVVWLNGATVTQVWKNASPGSAISSQNINVPKFSDYKAKFAFVIIHSTSANESNFAYSIYCNCILFGKIIQGTANGESYGSFNTINTGTSLYGFSTPGTNSVGYGTFIFYHRSIIYQGGTNPYVNFGSASKITITGNTIKFDAANNVDQLKCVPDTITYISFL